MGLLLSKAVSQLLLPPGGLILLAAVGLWFWRRPLGRAMVALALALLWLLSIEPVRDALLAPLENAWPALARNAEIPADVGAIVLLGGGLYEKAPEYGGRDSLGKYALMRTVYAADLAIRTGLPVYPTGGAVLTEDSEPEGVVMRRWLIRFGVEPARIHAEISANNTWENAMLVRAMLKRAGVRRVLLVTSALHMPRSVWAFERAGVAVLPAPCAWIAEREPYDLRSWLPRWNVLADSGDALHEYLGMIWYRVRYGWIQPPARRAGVHPAEAMP
ncbi:MAG: YdcF family protein [Mariprofundaceae bacterium]